MKIAFFGTGDFSKNILKDLIKSEKIDIKLVISGEDKFVGRKKILTKTPVKILAEEYNIEVSQPRKLKDNTLFFEKLNSLKLDFIVVVAYGKIIPKEVLDIPKHYAINIHGSLLPKYRGASPIQESIKNGDKKTGITIMLMSQGMDEGDILTKKEVIIDIKDKTPDIFKKFEDFGANLLIETLEKVILGKVIRQLQDNSKASYCSKIKKSDGEINFKKEEAKQIYDKFRAYSPWPGVFSYFNGKKIEITDCFFEELDLELDKDFKIGDVIEIESNGINKVGVICKTGALIIKKIKLEGKKETDISSFINGNKDFLNYSF